MPEQFTVTKSKANKDILPHESKIAARDRYTEIWGGYKGTLPTPVVEDFEEKHILRCDLSPGGLKARGAEKLIAETKSDTLVYCAPRVGHAPDAIANLALQYGKKVVFFCPSSKVISNHQAAMLAYPNVELKFFRIAAMPVLNSYAKAWAKERGYAFLKFGLTDTPVVTAGLINYAREVSDILGYDPTEIWCAVSTGTMIRALQIAWPDAKPKGIAVARNMHDGEIGTAQVWPSSIPFLRRVKPDELPPFQTTENYDAKAWLPFVLSGADRSIFINVGADAHIERNLQYVDINQINSQREWHDMSDLNRSIKREQNGKIVEVFS
jgi:hypothetical protein